MQMHKFSGMPQLSNVT